MKQNPTNFFKPSERRVMKAFLVAVQEPDSGRLSVSESLDELDSLVATQGAERVGNIVVQLKTVSAKYYIGSGKVEEIKALALSREADFLVFDAPLGPSQQRNIEKLTTLKVYDRQEVILDIFAQHAATPEALLQVELARNRYYLPRLTGAWSHLSRQGGGSVAMRGEGEKQIEYDRRLVKDKISKLEKELEDVRRQRSTQRKSRLRSGTPTCAIVGYTNGGKSTLLNALTGADALAENKLFATLDPLTRLLELPGGKKVILCDTVGFVRKLPHTLVEAFKSTLEEAALADFLILLLDASSPHVESHLATTMEVLTGLGAEKKDMIVVFNKSDALADGSVRVRLRALAGDGIFLSCRSREGFELLYEQLERRACRSDVILQMEIPPERQNLVARLHEKCRLLDSEWLENGVLRAVAAVPLEYTKEFSEFAKRGA